MWAVNIYHTGHARIQEFSSGGGGGDFISPQLMTTFFLVLSLFYRSQMVNFKENYHFSRFQRGPNIFQWGPTFSRGVQVFPGWGSDCLFPIETHITCDFPVGSGPPAPPPLIRTCWLHMVCRCQQWFLASGMTFNSMIKVEIHHICLYGFYCNI